MNGPDLTTAGNDAGPAGTVPLWVVIPTYDEAENIGPLLTAVAEVLAVARPAGFRILVVDDGSPDGTAEQARAAARTLGCVEVLERPAKDGLARAYVAGFRHALAAGAEVIVEMDADFSHNPAYLPDLLAALEGADLVLGSRYISGGGVTDWGLGRRLLSRAGSAYAQRRLGLPVCDLTGGYKCIRREVLERIGLDAIAADGFGFQIEVTALACRAGFRVLEVPIVFGERRAGASKMSWRIPLEALVLVTRLRRRLARLDGPPELSEQVTAAV
ncbi:polyprenol monophosphomannose synthase [Conexibacter sp. DBS9H8]|uniref:polyprenol monophosphomannose synthase n=1 Tax=Conexibacter sp. DBS9H8 TaxID=2937801 RepID=UPI00200D30D0|nr:polyprenol monophosphomannose synthase [Conexibacter sp. DBS9H8]